MDISWKQALCGMFAIGMAAAVIRPSAFEEQSNTAPTPTPAAKAPAKVVVVKQAAATQPDGDMTEEQCARVPNGMVVADLVWKFGWPAGDYSVSAFAERLFYPVDDAGDDKARHRIRR